MDSYRKSYLDYWTRRGTPVRPTYISPDLSVIPECEESFEYRSRLRDRSDSTTPPPLLSEKVPNRHDEPPEYYDKLERKMKKFYRKLFKNDPEVSSDEFQDDIYKYDPFRQLIYEEVEIDGKKVLTLVKSNAYNTKATSTPNRSDDTLVLQNKEFSNSNLSNDELESVPLAMETRNEDINSVTYTVEADRSKSNDGNFNASSDDDISDASLEKEKPDEDMMSVTYTVKVMSESVDSHSTESLEPKSISSYTVASKETTEESNTSDRSDSVKNGTENLDNVANETDETLDIPEPVIFTHVAQVHATQDGVNTFVRTSSVNKGRRAEFYNGRDNLHVRTAEVKKVSQLIENENEILMQESSKERIESLRNDSQDEILVEGNKAEGVAEMADGNEDSNMSQGNSADMSEDGVSSRSDTIVEDKLRGDEDGTAEELSRADGYDSDDEMAEDNGDSDVPRKNLASTTEHDMRARLDTILEDTEETSGDDEDGGEVELSLADENESDDKMVEGNDDCEIPQENWADTSERHEEADDKSCNDDDGRDVELNTADGNKNKMADSDDHRAFLSSTADRRCDDLAGVAERPHLDQREPEILKESQQNRDVPRKNLASTTEHDMRARLDTILEDTEETSGDDEDSGEVEPSLADENESDDKMVEGNDDCEIPQEDWADTSERHEEADDKSCNDDDGRDVELNTADGNKNKMADSDDHRGVSTSTTPKPIVDDTVCLGPSTPEIPKEQRKTLAFLSSTADRRCDDLAGVAERPHLDQREPEILKESQQNRDFLTPKPRDNDGAGAAEQFGPRPLQLSDERQKTADDENESVGTVRTPDVRSPDVRTPDVRTPDVRTPDVRTPDVRTPDVRTADVRTPGVRTPALRTPDVGTPDVRTPNVRTPDVRTADVRTSHVRTPAVRTPDVRTADVRTPDVRTPAVRTPDVRTPDVRTSDVRTPEMMRNASVWSAHRYSISDTFRGHHSSSILLEDMSPNLEIQMRTTDTQDGTDFNLDSIEMTPVNVTPDNYGVANRFDSLPRSLQQEPVVPTSREGRKRCHSDSNVVNKSIKLLKSKKTQTVSNTVSKGVQTDLDRDFHFSRGLKGYYFTFF